MYARGAVLRQSEGIQRRRLRDCGSPKPTSPAAGYAHALGQQRRTLVVKLQKNGGNKGKGASLFKLSLQDVANVESVKN
jgi:hypothetical protein